MSNSYIQKFIFDSMPVKGAMVVLDDCWQEIAKQREYPAGLKQLLGELLAANVLLTANIKLNGKISCQIQGNPYFQLLLSECKSDFSVRATAKFSGVDTVNLGYSNYLNDGYLSVNIDSEQDGKVYQSVIAFNGNSLDEIINNFMLQSEQLHTWVFLAYHDDKIVGFILQQLPDTQHKFHQEIERIFMLAKTLTAKELLSHDLQHLLSKLFNEDDILLLAQNEINFRCSCSREKVAGVLRNLGQAELNTLIEEQGNISVDCDYCSCSYKFSPQELADFVLQISLGEIQPISEQIN